MCFRLDWWQPVLFSAGGVYIGVTHGSRPNIENWVFANPATGKPYWPGRIQEDCLIPVAKKLGIGRIGWHTFRHSHPHCIHELGKQASFPSWGHWIKPSIVVAPPATAVTIPLVVTLVIRSDLIANSYASLLVLSAAKSSHAEPTVARSSPRGV